MIALLLDLGGGYLAAKHIRNVWLLLVAAVVIGLASSITGALLVYAVGVDAYAPGLAVARAIAGAPLHIIVTVISALVWRRKFARRARLPAGVTQQAE